MTGSRLSQTDIHEFLAGLERDGFGTLEKGPCLQTQGQRLWLTLLDDGSPTQLRLRKLVLSIPGQPPREWFSTHPEEDRWQDIDTDVEYSSEEVLVAIRARARQ